MIAWTVKSGLKINPTSRLGIHLQNRGFSSTGEFSPQFLHQKTGILVYGEEPNFFLARETGFEPATSAVTGRRSNQLSYSRRLVLSSGFLVNWFILNKAA